MHNPEAEMAAAILGLLVGAGIGVMVGYHVAIRAATWMLAELQKRAAASAPPFATAVEMVAKPSCPSCEAQGCVGWCECPCHEVVG